MSSNAAVFARRVRLFAEFQEIVLAREALPPFGQDPRRINSAGGQAVGSAGTTGYRPAAIENPLQSALSQ